MKITTIKRQTNRPERLSIFIDGQYTVSLGEAELLNSKIVNGQELTEQQVEALKQRAANEVVYEETVRYALLRKRSVWDIESYLQKKGTSPALTKTILNKLSDNNIVNDHTFVEAFVHDQIKFHAASRRKIIIELKKKHIADDVISAVLENVSPDESATLKGIIDRKRKQSRYQDPMKLMQYLSRQGFHYSDIKSALDELEEHE